MIDCVNISLLRNVDAAVLLPDAVSPLQVDHRSRRRTRTHLSRTRTTFHFLLRHTHPVLMRVGRHRCLDLRSGYETRVGSRRTERMRRCRVGECAMGAIRTLVSIRCTIEGRQRWNGVEASSRRAMPRICGDRPHTTIGGMLMRGRARDAVMPTVAGGIVVERARKGVHRGLDRKASRVMLLPALTLGRRQHAGALGEGILAI